MSDLYEKIKAMGLKLKLESWPPQPEKGMIIGSMATGIKATDLDTGFFVIETESYRMLTNRTVAIEKLMAMVKAHKTALLQREK